MLQRRLVVLGPGEAPFNKTFAGAVRAGLAREIKASTKGAGKPSRSSNIYEFLGSCCSTESCWVSLHNSVCLYYADETSVCLPGRFLSYLPLGYRKQRHFGTDSPVCHHEEQAGKKGRKERLNIVIRQQIF